ncbi:hypothetical protein KI387_041209 [Taxus chinensis]|uniref:Uncharacterized protein n=1 Tax=Taxus chinensis TaxID=29808 RepID=A0AA38C2L0_TAXCH|nr:hypothetical protein KI387_041209 [Taxus chinensis]
MAHFQVFLLLLFMVVAPFSSSTPVATMEKVPICSYIVNVETSCVVEAGTADPISLRFGDSAGNHVLEKHLKTPIEGDNQNPFKWCSSAKFKIDGPCVNHSICYLYLKRTGSDEWRPARAVVHSATDNQPHGAVDTFYFRRFIPSNVWHGYDYCDKIVNRSKHENENSATATSTHAMKYTYNHMEDLP